MISGRYFDRFSTPKYRARNPLQRVLIRRFLEQVLRLVIAARPVGSVLEVGVGEGFISGFLSEQFPGKSFTGVDPSEADLRLLSRKFETIETRVGSVYDLGFLSRSFDLVICAEVLEHLEDPERALDEIHRRAPRRAIFTVPHEPWFMLSNFLRGKNVVRFGNDADHVRHFTPRTFRRLLETRFDVLELARSYPWLLALARPRRTEG